jgi:hypothetical protein
VDSRNIMALRRMYVAQMKAKATRAKQAKREAIEDKKCKELLRRELEKEMLMVKVRTAPEHLLPT